MNQVNVVDVQKNILSFILSAVERFLLKSSRSRHANARRHSLSRHLGDPACLLVDFNHRVTSLLAHWNFTAQILFQNAVVENQAYPNSRSARRFTTRGFLYGSGCGGTKKQF